MSLSQTALAATVLRTMPFYFAQLLHEHPKLSLVMRMESFGGRIGSFFHRVERPEDTKAI